MVENAAAGRARRRIGGFLSAGSEGFSAHFSARRFGILLVRVLAGFHAATASRLALSCVGFVLLHHLAAVIAFGLWCRRRHPPRIRRFCKTCPALRRGRAPKSASAFRASSPMLSHSSATSPAVKNRVRSFPLESSTFRPFFSSPTPPAKHLSGCRRSKCDIHALAVGPSKIRNSHDCRGKSRSAKIAKFRTCSEIAAFEAPAPGYIDPAIPRPRPATLGRRSRKPPAGRSKRGRLIIT